MDVKQAFLTPNPYSRPQVALTKVTALVIHWTGNPGSTAISNRNYFESLKTNKSFASSHFIVGLQGEVIQCIPENEIAYHAKDANSYSIGIENCHPDDKGKFNALTYATLIELCVMLCKKYNLNPQKALLRHYDITKKNCPKYFVEHPEEWQRFKDDVEKGMKESNEDKPLIEAVKAINAAGIKLDLDVWGSVDNMNLKYAETMVCRIGEKYNKKTYSEAIDFLVEKGCINNREVWDEKKFKENWCRQLLINVKEYLLK